MLITTTPSIEGKQIIEYKEVVFGEVVAGSNFIRDFLRALLISLVDALGHTSPKLRVLAKRP